MASRATRKQALVMGMVEGFFTWLWEQRYEHQPDNKTFIECRQKVVKATDEGFRILKNQTCNALERPDVKRIRKNLDIMHDQLKEFHVMNGVAFLIDAVTVQMNLCNGDKRRVFEQLYYRLRDIERTFDKKKEWEDPEGWRIARFFNNLEF